MNKHLAPQRMMMTRWRARGRPIRDESGERDGELRAPTARANYARQRRVRTTRANGARERRGPTTWLTARPENDPGSAPLRRARRGMRQLAIELCAGDRRWIGT